MFGWDFEDDAWSRFWRWNLIKICVWTCDKNSTFGSVVPLAMFCFYVRSMALEVYTERLFKIPNIASKCKYCVCWLVLQEMSKIPMFPDAPIYVMYMLVFAYLQILFAFFLLLHQLPLCWYFCHLDTVFAASLPPFLLTSATRGALVLETQSNYVHINV